MPSIPPISPIQQPSAIICNQCHTQLLAHHPALQDDTNMLINYTPGDLAVLDEHMLIIKVYCVMCPNPIGFRVISFVHHQVECVAPEHAVSESVGIDLFVNKLISIENNVNQKCAQLQYHHFMEEHKDMIGKLCLDHQHITRIVG
ncbi:uncharacterized protein CANTADRAFT_24283 [Suhomyces tanzawaensis NRRL Y-17324]|uniref:Uncharacterized protein n=1 Tax=Suhomyces tanzawaensis NRRL Y-17324 TaxID=984487 RepID=A0A1E4SB10_9ASCO|nr:uncharacterized protein CANTADRAFT_24283 [Suhomyces tanzawaensis NRRL Y-17324]ODV76710.1 hypothetical protein CANTADRAFT_24283 [Suhomyces tanzawaensis NRRL Y-17324]